MAYNADMSTIPQQMADMTSLTVPVVPGAARLEDYMALPEGTPVELIKGELVVSPAPLRPHQVIVGLLFDLLLDVARATGGQAYVSPIDVVLAEDTVVQPDVIFVDKGRLGILGDQVMGPPDLAVEVISPDHARRDRVHKAGLYAEHGVAEYWIVDPKEKVFEFFLLVDGKYQLQATVGDTYTSARLPAVKVNVAAIWNEFDRSFAQ